MNRIPVSQLPAIASIEIANMDDNDITPRPPAASVMVKSFLLIAFSYIAYLVVLFVAFLVVAWVFFPQTITLLQLPQDQFKSILDQDPARIFPAALLYSVLILNIGVCFAAGYLVACLAPVGKFTHGLFLAAILFVHNLQIAIGTQQFIQTIFMLMMAVSPIFVLLGANYRLQSSTEVHST